jgi:peptidoglycan/LPS O-acetylase OafA/YrhL
MDKSKVALISLVLFLFALPANAYVGPGAGLSLLGALWALIAAIAAAIVFVVAWPIRRMRRRKREARAAEAQAATREETADRTTAACNQRSVKGEKDLESLQTR